MIRFRIDKIDVAVRGVRENQSSFEGTINQKSRKAGPSDSSTKKRDGCVDS